MLPAPQPVPSAQRLGLPPRSQHLRALRGHGSCLPPSPKATGEMGSSEHQPLQSSLSPAMNAVLSSPQPGELALQLGNSYQGRFQMKAHFCQLEVEARGCQRVTTSPSLQPLSSHTRLQHKGNSSPSSTAVLPPAQMSPGVTGTWGLLCVESKMVSHLAARWEPSWAGGRGASGRPLQLGGLQADGLLAGSCPHSPLPQSERPMRTLRGCRTSPTWPGRDSASLRDNK